MTTDRQVIEKTMIFVRNELYHDSSGHDWWHVYRVWSVAREIAAVERANILVVELAALLHDISDYKLNGGDAEAAPAISRKWLTDVGVAPLLVDHVCSIVSSSGYKRELYEESLEAKIVHDADRLDAIGAIGIARAFAFGGFNGDPIYLPEETPKEYANVEEYRKRSSSSVNHFYEKLLNLKEQMQTQAARQVAEHRHRILVEYLDEFFAEWDSRDVAAKVRRDTLSE
jgi:uncharacterized protein